MKRIWLILLFISISFIQSNCLAVMPWQREILARDTMIFDADGTEVGIDQHVYSVREQSAGCFGGGGGGCGCN